MLRILGIDFVVELNWLRSVRGIAFISNAYVFASNAIKHLCCVFGFTLNRGSQDKFIVRCSDTDNITIHKLFAVANFQYFQAFLYQPRTELPQFFKLAVAIYYKAKGFLFTVTCNSVLYYDETNTFRKFYLKDGG